MAVTIKEIAQKANVSASAVSAVINNSTKYVRVGEKTRNKIRRIIEEVGYTPNIYAQSNRKGCTFTIGLVIDNLASRPVSLIVEGANIRLKQLGYHLIIGASAQSAAQELFYINNFQSRRVDGIIALPVLSCETMGELRNLYRRKFPMLICERPTVTDMDCVFSNLEGGTYEAARYLIKLGHKKIAFVIGDPESPSTKTSALLRYHGYRKALEEQGLHAKDDYRITAKDVYCKGGQEAAQKIVDMSQDDRPTAVMFRNDDMAAGAIKTFTAKGFKIPEDISIIGFENKPITESLTPSLTTIETPKFDVGEKIAELIVEKIHKVQKGKNINTQPAISVGFMPKLIIRDSCVPPK